MPPSVAYSLPWRNDRIDASNGIADSTGQIEWRTKRSYSVLFGLADQCTIPNLTPIIRDGTE